MEPASAGAPRGVSITQSSSPSRKQWRVVSENSVRNTSNEVQQGQELDDVVDFSSLQINGSVGVDEGVMQQRIHNLARQREEMEQMEIELRAQLIARAEIVEMQNSYDARFKEQAGVVNRLQEQLQEMEQTIQELERKMEKKERELHAVRLDNEAAWAKEDLLREQNKELSNYRRERDTIEAERSHQRQQLHELQEHFQDKERQLLELQEQHRVAQETLLYKDEQIRDAQAWISRVQEMDVLQSSTLQAELRERTEQYNQLWLGCQRHFADLERLHMQTIQQLQLELAGASGKVGTYNGESIISQNVANDESQMGPSSGNNADANGGGTPNGTGGHSNGTGENSQQYVSSDNSSAQANHAPTLPVTPSIVGMHSYLHPGQIAAVHPYVMHQQGANQTVATLASQSHVGQFHSAPAMGYFQQWPNHQAVSEGLPVSSQNQYSLAQAEESSSRSESSYGYEFSINGPALREDYLNVGMSQGVDPKTQISSTETQTLESVERSYFVGSDAEHSLQQISSQFHEALRLEPLHQSSEIKALENDSGSIFNNEPANQEVMTEKPPSAASQTPSESSVNHVHVTEALLDSAADAVLPPEQIKFIASGKTHESALLDERALLACIVRTIPPGGKIRISSTLPNRLGKMLAPLHWHDYKRKYGRLDDFVTSHPELFAIEEDYIQLREGAQGIIAATAAVAKAAAAAAASSPYSSFFPSVAVTPMADASRAKKTQSLEPKPVRTSSNSSHPSAMHSHHSNGAGSFSNVKILSKSKDPLEFNGHPSQPTENGVYSDRSGLGNPQSKVQNHARAGANFVGKQQGRANASGLTSRR